MLAHTTDRMGRRTALAAVAALVAGGVLVSPSLRSNPTTSAAPTPLGTITGAGYGATPRSGVFRDVNSNGQWDTGEPGQRGITVTAYCIADDGTDAS